MCGDFNLNNTLEFISEAYKVVSEENERLKAENNELSEKVNELVEENENVSKALEEALHTVKVAIIREGICMMMLGRETMQHISAAAERMMKE